MGLHPLQDCKERRCHDQRRNKEELVHFLQESTGAVHPLLNFADDFDLADHTAKAHKSTGSTASFKTHGKCMANLIKIDRQWGSFWIDSGTHNTHPLSKVC
jgi:hypothetical protein